jgi:conjugal transfer mating pair stabilization protein TraG
MQVLRKALEQKVRLYAKPRGWMLSSAHWPVPPETSSTWQRRATGIADRARNERLTGVVDKERLSRIQTLLHDHGIAMSKRQIAMDQNGDISLNLTPQLAAEMWRGGLINQSQLGAIANGGHARFSFAHNDLLVSSSTGFSQSGRSDTSTRFEAGKQAGPDTIEHFLGGGAQGQAMMANWLKGGFEMDRRVTGG